VFENGDWYGTPVNEAARLCAVADAGQVLVSEVVRLLVGNRGAHEFAPIGELELKGLPAPVSVHEVRWEDSAAEPVGPLPTPLGQIPGELPFSGRDAAAEALRARWREVWERGLQAVLVAGEPGVGKTRLVAEFARSVHATGARVLLGRASEHGDAPFAPWREAMRGLVRQLPDASLAAHVADHGGTFARLLPELSRRVPGLPDPVMIDPETERELLFEAHLTGAWRAIGTMGARMYEIDPIQMAAFPDHSAADRGGVSGARRAIDAYLAVEGVLPDRVRPAASTGIALLARIVDDRDLARATYEQSLWYSGRLAVNTSAWCGGPFDSRLGVMAQTIGWLDDAVRHHEAAIALADRAGLRPYGVIGRLELATVLAERDASGDRARAIDETRRARSVAVELGMPGWVERLDALAAGDPQPWMVGIPG
jgi:class 3 adenylate cyclase